MRYIPGTDRVYPEFRQELAERYIRTDTAPHERDYANEYLLHRLFPPDVEMHYIPFPVEEPLVSEYPGIDEQRAKVIRLRIDQAIDGGRIE